MNKTVAAVLGVVAVGLGLTACGGGGNPLDTNSPGTKAPSDTIIVGSANFAESQLLAEIYAGALSAKGVKVDKKLGIGSRETYLPALKDGSIDLIPEYTGNLLDAYEKNSGKTSADEVYAELKAKLPSGLSVLDKSAAEDKDSVVVSQETATKYNAKSIADLAPHCKEIVMGGPPEFKTRTDGLPGLEKHYGCTFADYKSLDAGGPLTVAALKQNAVQAADLFSTDASITGNNWVALADPKNNFVAQNIVPLINTGKATDQVKQVLNAVSAKLDTATLTALGAKVSGSEHQEPAKVAADWLKTIQL